MTTEVTKHDGRFYSVYFETGEIFGRIKTDEDFSEYTIKAATLVDVDYRSVLIRFTPDQIDRLISGYLRRALLDSANDAIKEYKSTKQ